MKNIKILLLMLLITPTSIVMAQVNTRPVLDEKLPISAELKEELMGSSDGQIIFNGVIDPGTQQEPPCSNYSDFTSASIEYFLTEDHLKLKRMGLGLDGLTMSDVSPVSTSDACQKIRDLIAANEEMQKPVDSYFMEKKMFTPHFYSVGTFYIVVYQPYKAVITLENIFIIDSNFTYLTAVTI